MNGPFKHAPTHALMPVARSPKFDITYCSNCGREFGPGNSGFSHCKDHTPAKLRARNRALMEAQS